MLPFGVNRLEQCRAFQRTVAKACLPRFPLVSKPPGERKLAKLNRQVPDLLSHRGFDGLDPENTEHPARGNEPFSQSDSATSNRLARSDFREGFSREYPSQMLSEG